MTPKVCEASLPYAVKSERELLVGSGLLISMAYDKLVEAWGTPVLPQLVRSSPGQLQAIPFFKDTKLAGRLGALVELTKRCLADRPTLGRAMPQPTDVWEAYKGRLGPLLHEEAWVVCLDNEHRAVHEAMVARGSTSQAEVYVPEVIRVPLREGTTRFLLIHNHPSGNLQASPEDRSLTRRILNAAETVGLDFVEHIIITSEGFFSFRTQTTILS